MPRGPVSAFLGLSSVLFLTQFLAFVPYWAEHETGAHVGPFYTLEEGNVTWILDYDGVEGGEWMAIAVSTLLILLVSLMALIMCAVHENGCCGTNRETRGPAMCGTTFAWLLALTLINILGLIVVGAALGGATGPKIGVDVVSIVYLGATGLCVTGLLLVLLCARYTFERKPQDDMRNFESGRGFTYTPLPKTNNNMKLSSKQNQFTFKVS
jgi:hypothetical protein